MRAMRVLSRRCLSFLLYLLLGSVLWAAAADGGGEPEPRFRVMTYNIHHGEGLDGKVDLQRTVDLMQAAKADIVALQEVDKGTQRTGRMDFPAELARLSGMTCVFSNNYAFQGGEYGNAVLTRFPVRQTANLHYRMVRPGEQRGLLQVVLDVHGRELVLLNTHLDYRADDVERLSSAAEIGGRLSQYPQRAVMLCGDFNDVPDSRTYQRFGEWFTDAWGVAGKGTGFTYPAREPSKRIDYIWVLKEGEIEPLELWIPRSEASDHLPVVGEFRFRPRR